jgi:hypothetical protein
VHSFDPNFKRKWNSMAAPDYARHEGMGKGIGKGVRNLLAAELLNLL